KVSANKVRGAYEPYVFKDFMVGYILPGMDATQDVSFPNDERMKLAVFLKEPALDEVEKTILTDQGGRRLRINTIVAVFPDANRKLNDLLLFAAKIVAAE